MVLGFDWSALQAIALDKNTIGYSVGIATSLVCGVELQLHMVSCELRMVVGVS